MARNEEKQFGRLNRLYLEKDRQEYLKKHPPRPKLISLTSAEEIGKWLPSIKRDIDFCLKMLSQAIFHRLEASSSIVSALLSHLYSRVFYKTHFFWDQSQVTCYPDTKIEEFSQKIEHLSREYKAFLRKLKQLDPSVDVVPWTERAYNNKRNRHTETTSQGDEQISPSKKAKENETRSREINNSNNEQTKSNTEGSVACVTLNFSPIVTPVLDTDEEYQNLYGYNDYQPEVVYNSNPDVMDRPLEFAKQAKISCQNGSLGSQDGENSGNVLQIDCCSSQPREHNSVNSSDKTQKKDCGSLNASDKDINQMRTHVTLNSCNTSLNLPYSDSSSDETEDHDNR